MNIDEGFAALSAALNPQAQLLEVVPLTGGVSADVQALTLRNADGETFKVVVRQHPDRTFKDRSADLTRLEYDLLAALYGAGLPVPEPLMLDVSSAIVPAPALVMTYVEGSAEIDNDDLPAQMDEMAQVLCAIHDLPASSLPALPDRLNPLPEMFQFLPEGTLWQALREYLSDASGSAYRGRPSLLHGDFWPQNLLWRDGELVAVLDWEDAAIGDPMADVAGARVELGWTYGEQAVAEFTRAYDRRRPIDRHRLSLWEVYVATAAAHFMHEWGLPAAQEAHMRSNAQVFARRAAQQLLGLAVDAQPGSPS